MVQRGEQFRYEGFSLDDGLLRCSYSLDGRDFTERISCSLQNLVGVARDLLTSVERFRVEAIERK